MSPIDVVKFTAAFGYWLKQKNGLNKIVIGRDARPSGETIAKIVSGTLQSLGMDVVDLGLSTTPTVELAVKPEEAAGGIIITASHNPLQWNALKLLNQAGEFVSANDGKEILELAEGEEIIFAEAKKLGSYTLKNDVYIQKHIEMILNLPLVDADAIAGKDFKIALDCVNSTGGIAVPMLLELLNIEGAVVTLDAMHCQKDTARSIRDAGADYLLAVKDNQPSLHEDVKLLFDEAIPRQFEGMGYDHHQQVDGGHGRVETRRVWVTRDVDWLRERGDWPGLRSVVCVESKREMAGKAPSIQRRYYITDLDHRQQGRDAAYFAGVIRSHWSVENQLHWQLDVSFDEDQCRVRQGYAAENLSRLRRTSLALLKREKTCKLGIASKRLRAGWDPNYLLKVLNAMN